MTDEEFQAHIDRLENQGLEFDHPIKEAQGWTFGERARVLEDDEPNGLFEGDEGTIVCELVGSQEYNNEREAVFLVLDGADTTMEVDASNIEGL